MVKHEPDGIRVVTLSADYNKALTRWEKIDDFCEGDRETIVDKYLTQHYTEKLNTNSARLLWAGRRERTGFECDAKPYLDIHTGHLAREINFGAATKSEQLKSIIDDATGYGETAQELYKQKVENRLKHGLLAVLVDGPSEIADNKQAALDNGERSYQVLFNARQILSYSWFNSGSRKGQVKEAVLQADPVMVGEELRESASYFYLPDGADRNLTASFVRETLVAESKDAQKVAGERRYKVTETKNGSEKVPLIPLEIIGRGITDSKMLGVVNQSWKVFNSISVCDSINHHQGFPWNIATGVNEDEVSGGKHEGGLSLFGNPDAKVMQVPAGIPTGYENQIAREKATLKRIGMWENNQLADDTAQIQSADSKSLDQRARLKNYEDLTNQLERSELRVWQFVAMYEGADPKSIALTIERDFGLDDETAAQATRGLQFSRATQMGVDDIKKNLIKLDVLDMEVVCNEDEKVEDARARLLKAVDDAQPPAPLAPAGFGGGPAKPKPTVTEKVKAAEQQQAAA